MADINVNQPTETNRAESFNAFVQINSLENPSNYLRLKSLQTVPLNFNFTDEDNYTDDGKLFLVKTGQNNTSTINLRLTADLIDDVNPPTNEDTVSWWLREKEQGNRVTLTVRYIYLTKESSDEKIRLQVELEIIAFGFIRNVGGAIELPVEVRIMDDPFPILIRE